MIFRSKFFQNLALRTQYDSIRTPLPPMSAHYAWGRHRGTTYANIGAVGPVWTKIGAALGRFGGHGGKDVAKMATPSTLRSFCVK